MKNADKIRCIDARGQERWLVPAIANNDIRMKSMGCRRVDLPAGLPSLNKDAVVIPGITDNPVKEETKVEEKPAFEIPAEEREIDVTAKIPEQNIVIEKKKPGRKPKN